MSEITVPISFFGKLPSRGDFVRAADSDHHLTLLLDQWAGQGLELLSSDVGWKQVYDAMPGLSYAFLGSRRREVVAGYLLPSQDASQRRFPFLCATRFEHPAPLEFMGRSPLAFGRLWTLLSRLSREAVLADDAVAPLRGLNEARPTLNIAAAAYDASYTDFLDLQTLASLEQLLHGSGHALVQLKWLIPALGLLLQPVLGGAVMPADKGLSLPLPQDPLYRPMVAAFWLDLVAGFLGRADLQLAVLLKDGPAPRLALGFNGPDGNSLHSVFDTHAGGEYLICVDDAEWVDEQMREDYALHKLGTYLERDELSMRSARQVFRETFLGA